MLGVDVISDVHGAGGGIQKDAGVGRDQTGRVARDGAFGFLGLLLAEGKGKLPGLFRQRDDISVEKPYQSLLLQGVEIPPDGCVTGVNHGAQLLDRGTFFLQYQI